MCYDMGRTVWGKTMENGSRASSPLRSPSSGIDSRTSACYLADRGVFGDMASLLRAACWVVVLCAVATGVSFGAWTTPVNLTRTGADGAGVVLAADSADRVHVLINRLGLGMWHCYVEDDVRRGWQWISNGVAPAIAADGLGNIHAVWSEGWEIRYRRWSNGAWEADTATLSNGTGDAVKCDVCADSENNIHVVWGKGGNVWYNRRSAATGTWDGPQQITFTNDMEGYLPPRVGAVGTAPVVVWGRDTGGENRSVWFTSKESGTWASTQLPTAHTGASSCDIDVTPSGEVHCTWDDAYDIWHARCVNGSWTLLGVMTTGSSSLSPRISAVSPSKVDLVWRDDSPGYSDMYTSSWNGTSWSTPHGLTGPLTNGVVSPDITHGPSGRQYAAYSKAWDIWLVSDDTTDTTPPPAPVTSNPLSGDSQVTLNWTNPEAIDLSRVRVVYRTDRYPLGTADGTVVVDRAALWGADSFVHTNLTNGTRYYYSIFLCDEVPNWSAAAHVMGEPRSTTCLDAKRMADNQQVNLKGKVVTAVFGADGCIYVEEPNRTSGIRVAWSGSGIAVGDKVDVSGVLGTRQVSGVPSERQISSSTVTQVGSEQVKPIGITCRAIGGAALADAPGVANGVGQNNMGLLVRFTGRVTKVIGTYIYVDDGSRVANASASGSEVGVMVKCAATPTVAKGDVVTVTGVIVGSVPAGWSTNRAYVQARTAVDVVKRN